MASSARSHIGASERKPHGHDADVRASPYVCVQHSVAVEIGSQTGQTGKGQLDTLLVLGGGPSGIKRRGFVFLQQALDLRSAQAPLGICKHTASGFKIL